MVSYLTVLGLVLATVWMISLLYRFVFVVRALVARLVGELLGLMVVVILFRVYLADALASTVLVDNMT